MFLMIKSGPNFMHVRTAQLSWHVQNCDLIWSLYWQQEQLDFLQDLDFELITLKWDGSLALSLPPIQLLTINNGGSLPRHINTLDTQSLSISPL